MEEKARDKYLESIDGESPTVLETPSQEPKEIPVPAPEAPVSQEEISTPEKLEKTPADFVEKPKPDKKEIPESGLTLDKEAKTEDVEKTPKQEIKSGATAPAPSGSNKVQDWVKKLKGLSVEDQIEALCGLAFQEGIDFAIQAAKELDNAYVLDEFHANLVDKLYKELIEKGKLKQF